jgi:pimeloyl-ACP methyl ester carboxylesterase
MIDREGSADKKNTEYSFKRARFLAFPALAVAGAYADGPDGTQRYIEVRGAKLYTQIYGHGAPILFLHGGMAFFDNNFAKQWDYFAMYDHWMILLAKSYDMWLRPVVIEPADLKKISIPVLVMAGDHDFSSVEKKCRDIPRPAEWAAHHCAGEQPRNIQQTTGACQSRNTRVFGPT